jgi:WD40 repeat protein
VAAQLPPLRRRIFEHVFLHKRSHVETYEVMRSGDCVDLSFGQFLAEVSATYRAVADGRRGRILRELGGAAPPVEDAEDDRSNPFGRADQRSGRRFATGALPRRAHTDLHVDPARRLWRAGSVDVDAPARGAAMTPTSRTLAAVASVALVLACATEADRSITGNLAADYTSHFSTWSEPANLGSIINTTFNEQGPTLSNDERSLYFGSDRPGGIGGFDIWVSERACTECAWETPQNLGPGVNTTSDETGPGLSIDGHLLFFRSTRPGGAGLGDVFLSKRANPKDDFGWGVPVALGPDVNTAAAEAGAEFLESAEDGEANLYFNRAPLGGTADLYAAAITRDGETRGLALLISELSDPIATDQGPTLRSDGREVFFFSTRPGGIGGADLWTSTRRSVHDSWTPPVNAGAPLNSTAAEQQPSLSSGGLTLLFASSRAGGFGGTDIWMSTRARGAQ